MPSVQQTVRVDLDERSYDIKIAQGLLVDADQHIAPLLTGRRIAIITDENVADLHLQTLVAALERAQYQGAPLTIHTIILPDGEGTKSFEHLQSVLSELLAANFSRADTLIALGGGVIGDLTGFAASILKRGCGFMQIPTTLLAQVDSAVGGKTAINTPHGKNLVGCFYQPSLVLSDLDVLSTLPLRQLKAGYAEVLKYGLIDNPEFFNWLEENGAKVLAGDVEALTHAVALSCRAKAAIVKADEREQGCRALLNLGHSFAHAIEGLGGYDGRVLHGEAVSIGMLMAFEYSQSIGVCSGQDVERLRAHLQTVAMPILSDLPKDVRTDADEFFAYLLRDKKNTDADVNLILAKGIGASYVANRADKPSLQAYLSKALAVGAV